MRGAQRRLSQAKAQRAQSAAQLTSAQKRVAQQEAMLSKLNVIYDKYNAYAPLDGVVTNLPVRVGETVVPGIQSSTASTIMTIADMSEITAEVHVDETDIVNVALGQFADVTIDAIPNRTFKGKVTEIGDTALVAPPALPLRKARLPRRKPKISKLLSLWTFPKTAFAPGSPARPRSRPPRAMTCSPSPSRRSPSGRRAIWNPNGGPATTSRWRSPLPPC